MNLSVIVPAVNEEQSIVGVISNIKKALHDYDYNYEIIVVDDGSTDKTFELAASQGVRVIQHSHNRGYGVAIRSGIKESKYDWILITDGDSNGLSGEEFSDDLAKIPGRALVLTQFWGEK
jgi:glycosyltransferase involved in cell wall biosynthesis